MLLAAAGGRRNARMLGVTTFLYKLAGVIVFVPLIPWADAFLGRLNFPMPTNVVLAQVLLVLLNAAIFYPWPQVLIHSGSYVLSHMRTVDLSVPIYLDDDLLEIPSLAVRLLAKEMIRLTNDIEAVLQIQLYPDSGENDLEKFLPSAITELAEACEQYMYAIQPPSIAEDPAAMKEYRTISYAMLSLREVARLTTGRFRMLLQKHGDGLAEKMGSAEWSRMASSFMGTIRDAFHAFSLGDADLAQRALEKEGEFEKFVFSLRSRLLQGETRLRENSALVDFATVARRLLHSALEVVRGDVFVKLMQSEDGNPERAGECFGQE
jgi:Na+/phosphate symporter